VPVGTRPVELELDPVRARLYVANFGSDTVTVVGAFSNTVLTTVPVGANPFGVAVDGLHSTAYVSNAAGDTVSVISTAVNAVLATIDVDQRAPLGIDVDPAGTRVYVANSAAGTLSIIDTATRTVIGRVDPVGRLPIAFGRFLGALGECPTAPLAACDDDDPFTADACAPNAGCEHAGVGGPDGVASGLSALESALRSSLAPDLGGRRALGRLDRLLRDALKQLGMPRATDATTFTPRVTPAGAQARRRLKRVNRTLTQFIRLLERGLRRGTIERDLGWRLLDLARATQQSVRAALGQRAGGLGVAPGPRVGPKPAPPGTGLGL
jgi:YVTN family beta-propeller protein